VILCGSPATMPRWAADGARLKEAGVDDVRIIEKGGDFGGAQCDTASFIYLPLLEETGYMPIEKYAHGPEILEHCQCISSGCVA
jgi:cation diffusion facilitator CzcD-associated flavoprotein CzcO